MEIKKLTQQRSQKERERERKKNRTKPDRDKLNYPEMEFYPRNTHTRERKKRVMLILEWREGQI